MLPAGCEQEAPEDGADGGGGVEQTEHLGAAAKHPGREQRQQRGVRHHGGAGKGDQGEGLANGRLVPCVAETLAQFIGQGCAGAGRSLVRRKAEAAGEMEGRDFADGGGEKAGGLAREYEQGAGEGRTQNAREVERRRVERDGVGQIGAIIHELREQALAIGPVEALDDALKQREPEQQRDTGGPREYQGCEQEGMDQRGGLRGEEHTATVRFVREHADERGQ